MSAPERVGPAEGPAGPGSNRDNLEHGLGYLGGLIAARLAAHAGRETRSIPPPKYLDDGSPFGNLIRERHMALDEYVVLMLGLAPHVKPGFLDRAFGAAITTDGAFPEFGGRRDGPSRALIATGEMAAFLLADDDLSDRFEVQRLFGPEHWFSRESIVSLEPPEPGAPMLSGRILIDRTWADRLTLGHDPEPSFGLGFPAHRIATELGWDDLVMPADTLTHIQELLRWVAHRDRLGEEWMPRGRVPPGYRALFHGPPGTGKTLTATLLGKHTGRKIFRIDLSTVVSKYIGETEKNLASLFDRARSRDWILFFDEADALFGKRTGVSDAHDRYANQEVSYLLQRVEDFDGLVILATNFKANLDDAFLRRFNAVIKFPFPEEADRARIWTVCLPQRDRWEDGVDLPAMLARFELAGGGIVNAVQHACIQAIARGSQTLTLKDALLGVRREIEKEGRVFRNVLE